MYNKVLMFLVAGIFVLGISKLSFAMMCGGHDKHQQIAQAETEHKHEASEATAPVSPTETVNVGNKICPVSGEKIEEKTKTTYEYKGKTYNFCCASCIDEFKKDPEIFIKKVEEELKATTDEEKGLIPEPKVSESMHEGHHR